MSSLSDKIYSKAPVFLQNMGISFFGYTWKKRRFGGVFETELVKYKNRERFTEEQWSEYTNHELRKLLNHAYLTVPYYQEVFKNAGLSLSDLNSLTTEDLHRIPFLEKAELRKYGSLTMLSTKLEKGGEFFASSGSTGTPTRILFSHAMHQRWSAGFEARIRHWAGVDRHTARGTIGGRRVVQEGNATPPFYRYNFIEKQVYFSAYHITVSTIKSYLKGITDHKVQYMTGYAMSNYFLARFIKEAKLQAPTLKAVITSSEKLTDEMRETFQHVYNCKTYDSWSGVEACALVSECEHGSLHVSPDIGIIEILDESGNPVKPGEVGEVVCTGLVNFDQPLIRYRIGDMMRLGNEECKCGRKMPVIKEIVGRIEDTVVGLDGREMVRFHGIFINLPNLFEGQIIQHTQIDFEIKIVTNGRWTSEEESTLRKRMQSQLGAINLQVNEVVSIPRNQNGKFKSVISHVKRDTVPHA